FAVGPGSRRDEYSDRNRNVAPRDQVVKDRRNVVLRALPVLKDHHTRRRFGFVLRGDVDPPVARRAFKDFARPFLLLNQFAFRNTGLLFGFGRNGVNLKLAAADGQLLFPDLEMPSKARPPWQFGDGGVYIRIPDAVERQQEFLVARTDA